MYNTFILNFSPISTDPSPIKILEYIRGNGYTYQYLVPFTGTVILKSTATLTQLLEFYTPFFRPNNFVLAQVNTAFMNGLLPPQYWEWVNSASPPALIAPSV